jgi:hypothetical protein
VRVGVYPLRAGVLDIIQWTIPSEKPVRFFPGIANLPIGIFVERRANADQEIGVPGKREKKRKLATQGR